MATEFDPEGSGFDMETARRRGIKRGPSGHFPSAAPLSREEAGRLGVPEGSSLILKGRKHPTFQKEVEASKQKGRTVIKRGGRLFSVPNPKAEVLERGN